MWKTDFIVPVPRIHIQRELGDVKSNEVELAIEAIDKVRNIDSEWQGFQNWQLGEALAKAGLLNGSYAYLKRYMESAPDNVRVNTNFNNFFCGVMELLGRFEEEIDHFSVSLSVNPDKPLILGQRAMTYSRTGQYGKAEQDLRELAKVFPRNFAQFYHLYWTREMEAAREYYAWLESQPRLQPVFKYWGAFLLGDIDKGMDYLETTDSNAWGLKIGSVRCLPQSIVHQVWSYPRHHAKMESFGITDAWRDELLERVNQLTSVTGITVQPDEDY